MHSIKSSGADMRQRTLAWYSWTTRTNSALSYLMQVPLTFAWLKTLSAKSSKKNMSPARPDMAQVLALFWPLSCVFTVRSGKIGR